MFVWAFEVNPMMDVDRLLVKSQIGVCVTNIRVCYLGIGAFGIPPGGVIHQKVDRNQVGVFLLGLIFQGCTHRTSSSLPIVHDSFLAVHLMIVSVVLRNSFPTKKEKKLSNKMDRKRKC
ncbi:hypothetical protein Hanom_Chr14g01310401 [Helianthus anomalus]